MDWSNERYVRVYTRDTVDWELLPWEARSLFLLVLRKVDRAGVIELGRHGGKGLAVAVGMPPKVVETALAALLEDGCVELHGSTLVVPNFVEAQEATRTDAQRARDSREARRDRARGRTAKPDGAVTVRDDHVTVRDATVTSGHEASQTVTRRHSTPSRAVPIQAEPSESRARARAVDVDAREEPVAHRDLKPSNDIPSLEVRLPDHLRARAIGLADQAGAPELDVEASWRNYVAWCVGERRPVDEARWTRWVNEDCSKVKRQRVRDREREAKVPRLAVVRAAEPAPAPYHHPFAAKVEEPPVTAEAAREAAQRLVEVVS